MNFKLLACVFSVIFFQANNCMEQSAQPQPAFITKEYQLPGRTTMTRLLLKNGYKKIVDYHFPVTEWCFEKVTFNNLVEKLHRYRSLFMPESTENDIEEFVVNYAPRLMDVLLSEHPEASADIDAYVDNRKQYFAAKRTQPKQIKP